MLGAIFRTSTFYILRDKLGEILKVVNKYYYAKDYSHVFLVGPSVEFKALSAMTPTCLLSE